MGDSGNQPALKRCSIAGRMDRIDARTRRLDRPKQVVDQSLSPSITDHAAQLGAPAALDRWPSAVVLDSPRRMWTTSCSHARMLIVPGLSSVLLTRLPAGTLGKWLVVRQHT